MTTHTNVPLFRHVTPTSTYCSFYGDFFKPVVFNLAQRWGVEKPQWLPGAKRDTAPARAAGGLGAVPKYRQQTTRDCAHILPTSTNHSPRSDLGWLGIDHGGSPGRHYSVVSDGTSSGPTASAALGLRMRKINSGFVKIGVQMGPHPKYEAAFFEAFQRKVPGKVTPRLALWKLPTEHSI